MGINHGRHIMKNILLLAMSTLGREIKDNYYTYGNARAS